MSTHVIPTQIARRDGRSVRRVVTMLLALSLAFGLVTIDGTKADAAVIGAYGPHAICNTSTHPMVVDPDFIRNPLPGSDPYYWGIAVQQWNGSAWNTLFNDSGALRSDQKIGVRLGGRRGYFRIAATFTYFDHNAGQWVSWPARWLPHVNGTTNTGYCKI